MGTSLTDATGWIARVLLSAAMVCFNGPRLAGPDGWTHDAATEHVDAPLEDSGKTGFHATVTVGHGRRQVTVRLDFGRAAEHDEDQSL